ncbi:transposase [Pseudomonas aeruginosa]|nr:transposase [Pseudomonas aeruginosa]
MRPDAKVQKVYLYPKPVDFRKSINGLAALVELDIKVEVFNPVLFVFLNRTRSQVKILYWERNGFCLWLKRLSRWKCSIPCCSCSSTAPAVRSRSSTGSAMASACGSSVWKPNASRPSPMPATRPSS